MQTIRDGWRCPSCGTCYAPWVPECDCESRAKITYDGGSIDLEIPVCDRCYIMPCRCVTMEEDDGEA